jgi:hypothetical protein
MGFPITIHHTPASVAGLAVPMALAVLWIARYGRNRQGG